MNAEAETYPVEMHGYSVLRYIGLPIGTAPPAEIPLLQARRAPASIDPSLTFDAAAAYDYDHGRKVFVRR